MSKKINLADTKNLDNHKEDEKKQSENKNFDIENKEKKITISEKDDSLKSKTSDKNHQTKIHKSQKDTNKENSKNLTGINIFLLATVLLLIIMTTAIATFSWFKVDEIIKTQDALKDEITNVKSESDALKTTLKPVLDQIAQIQPQKAAPTSLAVAKPDLNTEFYRGNSNADIVWIEYSDLECPFCARLHPDLVKITQEFPQIAWVYRHLPIEQLHPDTKTYSLAIECVAKQKGSDAYWQMIDSMMKNQENLKVDELPAKAAEYGVNQDEFKRCMDNKEMMPKIDAQVADFRAAIGDNQYGTPASVIYNQKTGETKYISGALPYADLKQQLEAFINESN